MSELEREIASLQNRVLQLETQQIALKKSFSELEFRLDVLTERFNSRTVESLPQDFRQELENLRREMLELQQRCDRLDNAGADKRSNNGETKDVASVKLDDEEILKEFNERVDRQLSQESRPLELHQPSGVSAEQMVASAVNQGKSISIRLDISI